MQSRNRYPKEAGETYLRSGNKSVRKCRHRVPGHPALLTLALIMAVALSCTPVHAHTAAEMGIAPDQYDQGIPIYWPYHAFFMTTGFGLLLTGFTVMRFRKNPDRYRIHQILQTSGGGSILAGLTVGIFMVSVSGAPHIRYNHDMLGAVIVLLTIATLTLGYVIIRGRAGKELSPVHRRAGMTSIGLMAINIVLGISMMAMVLVQ